MNEFPKITVIPGENGDPRVFVGEDEVPFEVWEVKANLGFGTPSVTLEIPVSAVEYKNK